MVNAGDVTKRLPSSRLTIYPSLIAFARGSMSSVLPSNIISASLDYWEALLKDFCKV